MPSETLALRPNSSRLDKPLVFAMGPNPEPDELIGLLYRQGAVVDSHSGRPETPRFLEMQRRMHAIFTEEQKTLVR
jgi:hypothetical protein